nr:MAG: hypothetical protein TU35_03680 [Thermoproteus sp. AZ2]
MYNCAYFAKFGFAEPTPLSFSSVGVRPPASGFMFRKHEHRDIYLPELEWIAFVNRSKKVGLAFIIRGDAYGVVEDQFFDVELDLVSSKTLNRGEALELAYDVLPFWGLERVDYVDDELIAGIESPSVVAPGASIRGRASFFPLRPMRLSVGGYIEERRHMSVLGRRGYNIDRVSPDVREIPLQLSGGEVELKPREPVYVELESPPLEWSFHYSIYAIPQIVIKAGGREIRRAFSINPDYSAALELLGRRKPWYKHGEELLNEAVDGLYVDRAAADHLYELAVDPLAPRPNAFFGGAGRIGARALGLIKRYLEGAADGGESWYLYKIITTGVAAKALKAAAAYKFLKDEKALGEALGVFETVAELYEKGELIHFFNGLQGGGGAGGMFQLSLAFDLIEDRIPEALKNRLLLVFRWAQRELLKLANAWAGNWETMEALALASLSTKFDFSSSSLGLAKAEAVFKNALNYFYDDGGWIEESATYHLTTLMHIIQGAEVLRRSGIDLYQVKRGKPVIKAAVEWLWHIMTPYHRMPALEDSGDDMPPADPFIIAGVRYMDPALVSAGLKLIERGARVDTIFAPMALAEAEELASSADLTGPPQRPPVAVLDSSGRFVVRSGEGEDAAYFILDYGPHGGWHGHPDKLSFELHAFGEPLAVDSGAAFYYGERHWAWNRRSIAHNTVTLEDRDQIETRGILRALVQKGEAVYAEFYAETYPGVGHTRAVFTPDKFTYLIKDTIRGRGRFRWNLNLLGSIAEVAEAPGAVIYKALSAGGRRYTVALPKPARIGQGWRKGDTPTIYMYYEEEVDRIGVLWGLISAKDLGAEDVARMLGALEGRALAL